MTEFGFLTGFCVGGIVGVLLGFGYIAIFVKRKILNAQAEAAEWAAGQAKKAALRLVTKDNK